MLALDSTTRSEYDAEATAADAAQAVVDALGATVYVKVYDGAGTVKASGTMGSPWATQAAGVITIGEVSSFAVTAAGAVDPTWYLRFEGGSRWVHGSFGLKDSGADFELSSDAWINGYSIRLGTVVLNAPSETAPTWINDPPQSFDFVYGTGGSYDFGPHVTDAEGGAITFSLAESYTGITITSAGVFTVSTVAAAAVRTVTVRATDVQGLSADLVLTVTVEAVATAMKWYPGHYGLTQANDSQATKFSLFDELGSGWQGAQVRYFWGDIESSLGSYDWSAIRADRDRLQSRGKRLWVQILTTKFGSFASIGNTIPTYMQTPAYNGGAVITSDRVIAQLWNSAVMDRYVALMQAFAAEFDDDDWIAGVNGEETAVGSLTPLTPYGYTGTAMVTQLKRGLTAMRASFARTPLLVYANFFPNWSSAQIQDFFEHLEAEAVAVGGPDNNPDEGTTGKSYYTGAVGTQDYRGTLPAGFANQRESTRDYPFADLYDYAVNTLQMNWMFTLRNTIDSNTSWASIKTFVDAHPTLVSTLPSVYT